MIKKFSSLLLAIIMILTLNGVIHCGPSFCSNNSGCKTQSPCCECCCLKSADSMAAIATANPAQVDPAFVADLTVIPSASVVNVIVHKGCEACFKDPQLMSKLNECKLFKMFVSRKDFV